MSFANRKKNAPSARNPRDAEASAGNAMPAVVASSEARVSQAEQSARRVPQSPWGVSGAEYTSNVARNDALKGPCPRPRPSDLWRCDAM